jgi:drug/metabolite transporter superfamily protein YnfA
MCFCTPASSSSASFYIAASLVWFWLVKRSNPHPVSTPGAALAIIGALMILAFAARVR